jgi:DNA mismatch repair protein MutS2
MDRLLSETLQFNQILDLLEPAGEAGRYHKHHLVSWKPGQENLLRKEYKRLEQLLAALSSDRKLANQLHSALSETPWLPLTLKALTERPLLLHECFEIKQLVYYSRQLKQLCHRHKLDKQYPFPDLDNLYALLDPDGQKSPAFTLSPAYDTRLAGYINRMQDLQQTKRQQEQQLLQEAQRSLHLNAPRLEIVVSRLQAKELHKLQESDFYYLADENFANLTFRLKDTPALATLKRKISALAIKLAVMEEEVLLKLSKKLANFSPDLLRIAEQVRRLDWDLAKAGFALKYCCCLPAISRKIQVSATQAVNLPVQLSLATSHRIYQPLDLRFTTSLSVLTGPNMGGKTTALKTAGQLCLLARYALPVPAKEAELCLYDNLWYNRVTEGDENLSSFGREIVSLVSALQKKGRSLFLLDELAKGTNPTEGEAILLAVLQYLANRDCLTLAATHYEQPARLAAATQYAIQGIDIKQLGKFSSADKSALEGQLDLLNQLMDYSLIRLSGKTKPPLNAIPIAQALGLPEEITRLIKL